MPTITMPNTFADGAVAAAADFNEDVYSPKTVPDSLDVINGQLDADNLGSVTVYPETIQRGAQAVAGSVGRSVNLDYFSDLFAGFINDDEAGSNETARLDSFTPIPGCSRTFHLAYSPSFLIFTFSIFGTNDGKSSVVTGTTGQVTALRLFWDGVWSPGERRIIPSTVRRFVGPGDVRAPGAFQRVWSGHYFLSSPGRGWHDVSLRIAADADQSRIRTGNMVVIALR